MYDNLRHKLDIDDLLFETRNKEYGAYQLRKRYNSVVVAGIILATLVVSSIVVIPFMLNQGFRSCSFRRGRLCTGSDGKY